ncbi:SDR family oxidoreductase [Acinetobacter baumannii]|uniref:SDR family oxidoreductase n=1 Tax=Acinetobacter baumannii TaxID=470 RepID=UPI0029663557|nr:SDR family oxidoreductase [Acinetobacter baumannii]MDW3025773.1 SDR family oxidoreductase [Acinetobacter baumannii]
MLNNKFSYKTALVTGATSGIGKAIVLALANQNIKVIALGRNEQIMQELNTVDNVITVQADVRDYIQLQKIFSNYEVDIVINNAGVLTTRSDFQTIEHNDIDSMIDINLKAPLHLTREALPAMVERKKGHIFFIGSSAGRAPHPNSSVYGASKAGISLFCDALRCDLLGTRVRVTEIAPGRVQTNLYRNAIESSKIQSELYDEYESIMPEDIAELILTALRLPLAVDVSRMEVFPTSQAVGGSRIVKKNN